MGENVLSRMSFLGDLYLKRSRVFSASVGLKQSFLSLNLKQRQHTPSVYLFVLCATAQDFRTGCGRRRGRRLESRGDSSDRTGELDAGGVRPIGGSSSRAPASEVGAPPVFSPFEGAPPRRFPF